MKKRVPQISFLVICMFFLLPVLPLLAGNHDEPPAAYWGSVSNSGNPVNSGSITAYVDQYKCSDSMAVASGFYGSDGQGEKLTVQSPSEDISLAGKTVRFRWTDGASVMWAEQTVVFSSGSSQQVNLSLLAGGTGLSDDASLKTLVVSTGELKPAFNANIYEYTVELPVGTENTPVVTPCTNDSKATLEITPAADVNSSDQAKRTTTLVVTAENGIATHTYQIVFNVAVKPGEGCFIATAAFGSYLDPHVWVLRQFRDQVLLQHSWGKAFVSFYYHNSPPAAAFIAQHDSLRFLTRCLLTPVIFAVQFPVLALVILFVCLLIIPYTNRQRGKLKHY